MAIVVVMMMVVGVVVIVWMLMVYGFHSSYWLNNQVNIDQGKQVDQMVYIDIPY